MKKNITKIISVLLCGLVLMCACTQKEEIKEDKNPVSVENSDAGETVKEDKTEVNPLGFENVSFFEAVAKCLEKEPADVTQEDIISIHYHAVGPEGDGIDNARDEIKDASSGLDTVSNGLKEVSGRIEHSKDTVADCLGIIEKVRKRKQ